MLVCCYHHHLVHCFWPLNWTVIWIHPFCLYSPLIIDNTQTPIPYHTISPYKLLQEFLGNTHKQVMLASHRVCAYSVPLNDAKLLSRRAVAVFTPTSLRQGNEGLGILGWFRTMLKGYSKSIILGGVSQVFLGPALHLDVCSAYFCFLLLATDAVPRACPNKYPACQMLLPREPNLRLHAAFQPNFKTHIT